MSTNTSSRTTEDYDSDVCIVGAGHIGLPWAAALAEMGFDVECIDVDEQRVEAVNAAEAPFDEPHLQEYLESAVSSDRLRATRDPSRVGTARFVGITVNAPHGEMERYLRIIRTYAEHLARDQIVVNRTTLPIPMVERTRATIAITMGIPVDDLRYATFPERLVGGKAIEEIESLPKVVGADDDYTRDAVTRLVEPFDGIVHHTDTRTAMLVKLIDNAYRDARFAIANQFAIVADELDIDAHEAIRIANEEYPRNDIPSPGPVGGKCLIKDPYFLMDEHLPEGSSTPDLFARSRAVNEAFERRIVAQALTTNPAHVAILGTSYKRDVGDETASPALRIRDELASRGVETTCCDPHVPHRPDFETALRDADGAIVAVDHTYYEERESRIKELADGVIVDVWGIFEDGSQVVRPGMNSQRQLSVTEAPE